MKWVTYSSGGSGGGGGKRTREDEEYARASPEIYRQSGSAQRGEHMLSTCHPMADLVLSGRDGPRVEAVYFDMYVDVVRVDRRACAFESRRNSYTRLSVLSISLKLQNLCHDPQILSEICGG